jgi:hypothetical protein
MIRARKRSAVSRVRKCCREVGLDPVFLLAAEGRVGEDDVHPVLLAPADVGPGQGVVVAHEARILDAVQQHVGDAEHVRQLLLLHRAEARLQGCLVLRALHVALAHVAMAQVRKPPVPQAGRTGSRRACGSIICTMKAVTARGV